MALYVKLLDLGVRMYPTWNPDWLMRGDLHSTADPRGSSFREHASICGISQEWNGSGGIVFDFTFMHICSCSFLDMYVTVTEIPASDLWVRNANVHGYSSLRHSENL